MNSTPTYEWFVITAYAITAAGMLWLVLHSWLRSWLSKRAIQATSKQPYGDIHEARKSDETQA
jgi:hypothetical protein